MMKHQILTIKDNLYILKRKFKVVSVEKDDVTRLKEKFHCDIVFKKNDFYYFCDEISDAEIIDEELCSEKEITKIVKESLNDENRKKTNDEIISELNKNRELKLNIEMLEYVLKKLKGETQDEIQKIS